MLDSDISVSQLADIPYSSLTSGERFAFWSYLTTAAFSLLTFGYLVYVTIRIIKLVGSTDWIIPSMFFCLQVAMLGVFGWYINLANDYRKTSYRNGQLAACAEAIVPNLAAFFLAIAVMLNVNKWIYFNFFIAANVRTNDFIINEHPGDEQPAGI